MEERIIKLETQFEYVRRDLDEIKDDNKRILAIVGKLATKGSVWGAAATGGGIAVALLGIVIAILTYLQAFHTP